MQSKQRRRRQTDDGRRHFSTNVVVKNADDAVENDVDQVVPDGVETADGEVPTERQDRQWPVWLVALLPVHRRSPDDDVIKLSTCHISADAA